MKTYIFSRGVVAFIVIAAAMPLRAQAPAGSAEPSARSDSRPEVTLLKEQNKLLQAHNEQLLVVVLWSVGIGFGIVVAFLGLASYLNNRNYAQERATLDAQLRALAAEVRAGLETQLATRQAALQTEISTTRESIQSEASAERLSLRSDLRVLAERIASDQTEPLRNAVSVLKTRLGELEIAKVEAEARYWEVRDVPVTAVRYWMTFIKMSLERGQASSVSYALDSIEKLIGDGTVLYNPDDRRELGALLNQLPPEFRPVTERVQKRL